MSAMYLQTIPAYVYRIRNLVTNEYYFGVRVAHIKRNRLPEEDFLIHYFSSSKIVLAMIANLGIKSFEGEIIYKDIDTEKAFWYEQDLIKHAWGDPLLLNKQYRDANSGKKTFITAGNRAPEVTARILSTKLKKYGSLSPVRDGSVNQMVATRQLRNNYNTKPETIKKMLKTKMLNGTMNANTVESRAKSRQTKIERYGCAQPKHTPETIEKLRNLPISPDRAIKCLETKKLNGTMNSNTPDTITRRKETLLAKWGTLNTREIAKLKALS